MYDTEGKRLWLHRIEDMVASIESCLEFVSGYSVESFVDDDRTFKAVFAELTILGEAAKKVPVEIRDKYPEIPWSKMAKVRDRYIHGYFRINRQRVWEVVQRSLPPALEMLRKVLQDHEGGEDDI